MKNAYILTYNCDGKLTQTMYRNEELAINDIVRTGLTLAECNNTYDKEINKAIETLENEEDYEIITDSGKFGIMTCEIEEDAYYTLYAYAFDRDKGTHEWYLTMMDDIPYRE